MPLQKQAVSFPLFGRSGGVAPPHVAPGKMTTLENAVLERTGELRKRYGQTALATATSTGGAITTGRRVDVYRDELIVSDATNFYTFSDSDDKWYSRGRSQRFSCEIDPIEDVGFGTSSVANVSVAYAGGLVCYVWFKTSPLFTCHRRIVDVATGAVLLNEQYATAQLDRVYASGNTFVIYTFSSATLRAKSFTTTNFTLSGSSTIISTAGAQLAYDVKVMGDDGTFFCAVYRSTGDIEIARHGTDLVNDATGTLTSPAASTYGAVNILQWDESDGIVYVGWWNEVDGVRISEVTKSSMAISAVRTIAGGVAAIRQQSLVGYRQSTTSTVFYVTDPSTAVMPVPAPNVNSITNKGVWNGAASTSVFKRSAAVASKPFLYGSTYSMLMTHSSTLQTTLFLVDGSDGALQARLMSGYAESGLSATTGELFLVASVSSTRFLAFVLRKTRIRWETTGTQKWAVASVGASSIEINADDTGLAPGSEANDGLALPGGWPLMYDSYSTSNIGNAVFPEGVTCVASAGGSMDTNSTYLYTACYSWSDRRGNLHRSAPCVPVSVAMAANNRVTVTIPTLRLTDRADVSIEIYRTEGNGTVLYRLGTVIANDTTVDTVSHLDTVADSTITSNEILYTTGGVLDNHPPPNCKQIVSWDNRLWAIATDYKNEVWFSKSLTGFNAAAFNPFLKLTVDNAEGGIKCAAAMDNQLVLFGAGVVYVVTGSGPNDLGQGEYSGPHIVTTKVGTTNPRSVVATPMGIMFASAKGIYLLDRGLNAHFIGADVEDVDTSTITGSLVVPDKNQVRFYTSSGTTLVYFWDEQQWATFTNQAAVGAANWRRETPCFLSSAGVLRCENTAVFSDDGATIPFRFRTGPMSLAGIQGLKRVYEVQLLGERRGDTVTLTVKDYIDNSTTADETTTLSVASVTPDAMRVGFMPKTQAMSSIELEVAFTSATEGLRFSGIGLAIGVKSGAGKLPAASRTA
jgi:hypothetical protein